MYIYNNYSILFLVVSISFKNVFCDEEKSIIPEESDLYDRLEHELRQRECCNKKMHCCTSKPEAPIIELRAVMIRCPSTDKEESKMTRIMKAPIYDAREGPIKHFQGFGYDEPLLQSQLTNCHKKLAVTMRIKNKGVASKKSQYVVIDHVFDPLMERKARILNPYVIKLKQKRVSQMYGMKFMHVVNSEAKEQIFNKHNTPGYKGCDTTSKNPTCGLVTYKGKVIPYSQGFCCSCDAFKNAKRQPPSKTPCNVPVIIYSDPAYLLDGVECPRNLKGFELETKIDAERLAKSKSSVGNHSQIVDKKNHEVKKKYYRRGSGKLVPIRMDSKGSRVLNNISSFFPSTEFEEVFTERSAGSIEDVVFNALDPLQVKNEKDDLPQKLKNLENLLTKVKERDERERRQVTSTGVQRRGGQNCADRYTPPKANRLTYHESAHCLVFSDLWYSVYALEEPFIEHTIHVQIFEKIEDCKGVFKWYDLTGGKPIILGTAKRNGRSYYQDSVAAEYSFMENFTPDSKYFSLNYKMALLLVPEGVKRGDEKKYPELANGPEEYLIVHPSQVSSRGDRCNVAGVGYEAFFKQPNRCSMPKSTCLANQPHHLWLHDHQAEENGKKGCFFLKNYGGVPKHPIRVRGNELYLALNYMGEFSTVLGLEVRADFNTVIRPNSWATITEVYIESTNACKTTITAKVTNAGLVSNFFSVKLADCPLDMPPALNKIHSKQVLIPPQRQHIFYLKIDYALPADRFHCSIEVLNYRNEIVALRRIRIQRYDRCICTWHCLCACVGSLEGLKCIPMSLTHYHAAGFQGSLPVDMMVVENTVMDDLISLVFYFIGFLALTLLIMGITKAIIGLCCCTEVGLWGFNVLMDPKPICRYYEKDLKNRKVVYNNAGWPVHPDTGARVRCVSPSTEFCMNVVFFFTYPLVIILVLLKRLCWPYYTYDYVDKPCCTATYPGTNRTCKYGICDLDDSERYPVFKSDTETELCLLFSEIEERKRLLNKIHDE